MKPIEKTDSYILNCPECYAEFAVVIIYAPGFRDFQPRCPYCGGEVK